MRLDAYRETEAGIQQAIIQGATLLGYIVLSTSEHRRGIACPKCHRFFSPGGGRGSTPGVPDLLIRHPSWERGRWLGVEVKGPTTRVSPEQQTLADAHAIIIVRSWEEVESLLGEDVKND